MPEDKNYLNDLMDYINENHRKRNEETDSMSDTFPSMGKPFTKKVISENPNIPQSDVQDYVQNVKDDNMENMMGTAMGASSALKLGGALEGMAAKLPSASRFRGLIDNPIVQKIREPFKQQRNIDLTNKASQEMADLAKTNVVKEAQIPALDEVTQQKYYKDWLKDKLSNQSELGYQNKQSQIQEAIQKHNEGFKLDPNLDQTVPGISQELIDAIIKQKAN